MGLGDIISIPFLEARDFPEQNSVRIIARREGEVKDDLSFSWEEKRNKKFLHQINSIAENFVRNRPGKTKKMG